MNWSSVLKFFVGLFLALGIIAGGGLVAARVMIARFSAPPPKPIYPNDKQLTKTAAVQTTTSTTSNSATSTTSDSTATKPLPAGAFEARVTQSIGLVMRDAPSGASIGGVDFNERVTVLETSSDGSWQKIRLSNDKEGWIKAGNVEQVN